MRVEYRSNNSGGYWWLDDSDWVALEKAGWDVKWAKDKENKDMYIFAREGRYLGALAKYAEKAGESLTLKEAVEDWEIATGKSSTDAGCPCCGPPHSFTLYDDEDNYVDSGPSTEYTASW